MKREMAAEGEIEGTPAEATWAMLTVIIIIVVVIIFCCALPFYRALEKRWHHWDDLGNDPRWDVENFQFSPTSPQLTRDPKYNRLSICSTDNSSSLGTSNSTSGINRGDSFRNNCVMPRFPDQVEFKLPPNYDDLFSKGGDEGGDSQLLKPPSTDIQYTEETKPEKAPQIKKMLRKQQPSSPIVPSEPVKPGPQDKKVLKNGITTQKTNKVATEVNKAQTKANAAPKTESVSNNDNSAPTPVKRNSKVLSKPNSTVTKPNSITSKPNQATTKPNPTSNPEPPPAGSNPTNTQANPAAPAKKTYKKIKKTVPTE